MKTPKWRNTHPDFKLNGIHYEFNELPEVGYSLIKEGVPFEQEIGDFIVDWCLERPYCIVNTSGSTGTPKEIRLAKEHMVNSALATGEFFQLESKNRSLLCLPCSGIAGKMMLVRAFVLGLELDYVQPSSSPLELSDKIYDFVAMVPLQVEKSVHKLDKITKLIIGGAPVSKALKKKLQPSKTMTFETYGMTETVTHIAAKPLNNPANNLLGLIENQNWFMVLPKVNISQDERNCLVIDAPSISTQAITTNDIVELKSESQFKWIGRYDSIINSGGIKLIPERIERKLASVIHKRFFVAGVQDETLGQKLILVVEGVANEQQTLTEKITAFQELDRYEVPKAILFCTQFVETATGKVDRKATIAHLDETNSK